MNPPTDSRRILNASEEGFRTTFDQVAVGLGFLTLDLEWAWVNRRLCQVLDSSEEELLQRSCLEVVCPEDLQTLLEHKRQIFAGGIESFALEQRCRRKDGSVFWASWTVSLARRPDGEAEHLVAVVDDISIRKWTEESLLRMRACIEGSSEGIAFADPEGRNTYHNEAFTRMFGYRVEEMAEPLAHLALSTDQAVGRAVFDTVMQGQSWRGELDMVAKDGRRFPVELRADAIRDERGQLIGLIGVHTDTSERRQLEGQLRQAQKTEAVGHLAGGVAHDFNNLLAVIQGSAELLLLDAGQLSAQANECLNHIVGASERAANLTRQLLVFSRKQVAQLQPVALNDLIRNLAKMLGRTIREDIRLEYLYADQSPFVQADPAMLEQVLLNLVVNARDAMPQSGHLQIATEKPNPGAAHAPANPEARAPEFVCLRVSDTGTGIAPEHLPRIFEPFFTTKEPGQGTGLGLATVYGLVKQHQGWAEVASRVGEGTTFKVFLPAVPPPAKGVAALQAQAELPEGTETILLVEDEYSVRMITRRVLETFNYKVHEATCPREALEVWGRHGEEIALLLTDIVMPEGVTGWDLAEQLRAQRPRLKVIFMSGYSSGTGGGRPGLVSRLNARFIRKPCSSRTILETVRRCLDDEATPNSGEKRTRSRASANRPMRPCGRARDASETPLGESRQNWKSNTWRPSPASIPIRCWNCPPPRKSSM
ncbi:MAG: PAS domain S-box protein [Verrucomicrobiota bacterium]|jgi:PAS domain S-box-containing protein